jgi:hypothetical protein
MGIRIIKGRAFPGRDLLGSLGTVMLSRSAAETLWPGQEPVGRRLQIVGHPDWSTVIGVVNDVKQNNLREEGQAVVYYPLVVSGKPDWVLGSPAYVVKSSRAVTIAPEIRGLVKEVAPTAPMYRIFTMASLASRSVAQLTFTMLTLAIAAGLALVLGAVGLYGVLSYVVAQRTREIGIRMALGAQVGELRRMVVAQGSRVTMVGVVVGVIGAVGLTRVLDSLLFGVRPIDVPTFAAMSAVMLGVALLASYIPARRASAVDPMRSLRGE